MADDRGGRSPKDSPPGLNDHCETTSTSLSAMLISIRPLDHAGGESILRVLSESGAKPSISARGPRMAARSISRSSTSRCRHLTCASGSASFRALAENIAMWKPAEAMSMRSINPLPTVRLRPTAAASSSNEAKLWRPAVSGLPSTATCIVVSGAPGVGIARAGTEGRRVAGSTILTSSVWALAPATATSTLTCRTQSPRCSVSGLPTR
mmetsp:Transcript_24329/g.56563  ORF Transcript_24329/g.56563 Transcript_24329/m.56563 type:complete len:209 (+) Transcript_24329:186-812(+)